MNFPFMKNTAVEYAAKALPDGELSQALDTLQQAIDGKIGFDGEITLNSPYDQDTIIDMGGMTEPYENKFVKITHKYYSDNDHSFYGYILRAYNQYFILEFGLRSPNYLAFNVWLTLNFETCTLYANIKPTTLYRHVLSLNNHLTFTGYRIKTSDGTIETFTDSYGVGDTKIEVINNSPEAITAFNLTDKSRRWISIKSFEGYGAVHDCILGATNKLYCFASTSQPTLINAVADLTGISVTDSVTPL